MDAEIDRVLARYRGVASRAALFRHGVSRHRLDNEVRSGELVTVLPRTYCRPWLVDDREIRERAALTSIGPPSTLSHLTALRRWGLLDDDGPVHVAVPPRRLPRSSGDLVVHRANVFPPIVRLAGLITVQVAAALATSWPLLAGPDRRAPAITAVRNRLVRPADLRAATDALPRLAGRRELIDLAALLADGCESELEIWGHLEVFDAPGLRHAVRQRWVTVRGHRYRLDLAYEEERVAVELDGARYHGLAECRERDIARDAALASVDWLTLRFSHRRLHRDIPGCRRDTLATLAARRR